MAKSKRARAYRRNAEQWKPYALYQLGLCYFEGKEGLKKDEPRGAAYIRAAAMLGYRAAIEWIEDYLQDDNPMVQALS